MFHLPMFQENFFTIKPVLAALVIGLVISGCSPVPDIDVASPTPEAETLEEVQTSNSIQATIVIAAESDNQLVSELTEQYHDVEYKEYDFGVMVEAIDGLRADSSHYWALYVNDEYGEAGANQLRVNQGDMVKWVYEELN